MQSTDNKVIYICVWQDKEFLFLKHERDGKMGKKILPPSFHELCTSHLLFATSSPPLCKELNLGISRPKDLIQDASFLQVMAELWSQETDSVKSRQGKDNAESNYYYCVSKNEKPDMLVRVEQNVRWHTLSSAQVPHSLTYVTVCDRRNLASELWTQPAETADSRPCVKKFLYLMSSQV